MAREARGKIGKSGTRERSSIKLARIYSGGTREHRQESRRERYKRGQRGKRGKSGTRENRQESRRERGKRGKRGKSATSERSSIKLARIDTVEGGRRSKPSKIRRWPFRAALTMAEGTQIVLPLLSVVRRLKRSEERWVVSPKKYHVT
jgi:hypothetical protein